MSYAATVAHIRAALQSLPAATVAKFTIRGGSFVDVDMSGSRGVLEEMVGQSRMFEIDHEGVTSEPVLFGGEAPTGYTDTIPLRVRYDTQGNHEQGEQLKEIKRDQQALVDAVHRSNWPTVSGLVHLSAVPGSIRAFQHRDDAGRTFGGYISEVILTASYDL